MYESEKQIKKTIAENCRLLNDALEITLRKMHNEKEVRINVECMELAFVTFAYTKMYLELK